ncbi:MAG: ABC transporter permease [Polyangiaceae bacterium]|nr:ABC transporter permease [Polyangiaceae bacterium]MBK8938989.1 ABC transporter permease [Polyangiaceae bacterium]
MHILRDPGTLAFAIGMPLIMLALFGYAVTFDVDHIPVVVADEDRTPQSREVVARLLSGRTLERRATVDRADEIEPMLRRREASVGVVVPRGFGASLARGETATVQLLVDAGDNSTATTVQASASRFAVTVNRDLTRAELGEAPEAIEARVRALYNPSSRSALFLVPGLVVVIQAMMSVLLTALTVAREWERGSMEQLFATPVRRLEIVIGKLVPYSGVAMLQLLLVLAAGTWAFDVPIRGSMLLLLALSALFIVAGLGQGLLISVVTKNQMVATQVAAMTSMLPAILLSGFILPIDNMPRPLQVISNVLPARHFMHAVRGILLRDVGAKDLQRDALSLAVFSVVVIAISTARFRRRVA